MEPLNTVVEQDHRTVKKRVWLAKGYGSFATAWRTLQGIEAINMIRKGRARWVAKTDAIAQACRAVWHRRLTPNPRQTPHLAPWPARSNLRNETVWWCRLLECHFITQDRSLSRMITKILQMPWCLGEEDVAFKK
jgi:hypothetical protein